MTKEKELALVRNPYGRSKENGREPFLEVYTNAESKPISGEYCNWHFQIISNDFSIVNRQSGFVRLCNCEECHLFGNDVFEYFSISEALRWIRKNTRWVPVDLWVDSTRFLSDLENKKFAQAGRYECPFLRTLDNDLGDLLAEMVNDAFRYVYANKEMIRMSPQDLCWSPKEMEMTVSVIAKRAARGK